jgi:hypothetical protein
LLSIFLTPKLYPKIGLQPINRWAIYKSPLLNSHIKSIDCTINRALHHFSAQSQFYGINIAFNWADYGVLGQKGPFRHSDSAFTETNQN